MIQKNSKYYLAASVALITFIIYLPSLRNEFVDWDDNFYVSMNTHIRSLNMDFFKWAFFDFYSYNWHPITWISHALDYAVWGLNPLGHHLTNNILHAVNTLVVVFLTIRLLEMWKETAIRDKTYIKESERKATVSSFPELIGESRTFLDGQGVLIAGGVTGFLFGLHPLHVESVAWVAERKDLLSALFFLLSITVYIKYVHLTNDGTVRKESGSLFSNKHYLFSLGFFVLALLSKPMAVSLPAVLLILDWYLFKRVRSLKTLWTAVFEKLPFIVLIPVSSILTILAQKSGNAIWEAVPLSSRVLVSTKSLVAYIWKMLMPLDLLPFYPYPQNVSFLSLEYFAAVALVVGITIACLVTTKNQKLWLSVWCYYVITLLPVLGIVQVGGQSMADRYTYLPSLGPFLITGLAVAWVSGKVNTFARWGIIIKTVSTTIAILVFVSMSYLTVKQTGIWKNGLDLWTYVIKKEPRRVLVAYYNRGNIFAKMGKYDKAIEDYNKVIAWNYQEYSKVYIDRGLAYLKVGQVGLGIADMKKACDLGDDFGCKSIQYLVKDRP